MFSASSGTGAGLVALEDRGWGKLAHVCVTRPEVGRQEYSGDAGWAMGYCRHPGCGETLAKQSEKRIDDVNVSM